MMSITTPVERFRPLVETAQLRRAEEQAVIPDERTLRAERIERLFAEAEGSKRRVGRPSPAKFAAAQKARIRELYEAGLNDAEIAADIGRRQDTTQRVRLRMGLRSASVTRQSDLRDRIDALLQKGMTDEAVAALTGVGAGLAALRRERMASGWVPNIVWSADKLEELRRMYVEEGLGDLAIAKHFGVSASAIYDRRRALRIASTHRPRKEAA